ncbi:hypothetical protein B0H67DRAFT_558721 [Lasiosphaeris hirsuta]|uniref:Amidohydrolase-related domain-containing protein n=1 Tax=Lasiosphaeris hirsuta TaxID=260670 RepID=A0AA39ZPH4_9PEZI|nr:hypothetical protein B0H67DRAFT_558721 [Lasiosphaeris hirsuta]
MQNYIQLSQGCSFGHEDISPHGHINHAQVIIANSLAREQGLSRRTTAPAHFAITNARLFSSTGLSPARTIIVYNRRITAICSTDEPSCTLTSIPQDAIYDGEGMTLLPGLIDSHAHPSNTTHLQALTAAGVTSTVLANCPLPALCSSLDNHPGLTSIIRGSLAATSPNSTHAALLLAQGGNATLPRFISNLTQIPGWVASELSDGGADFIKIIGSAPAAGLGAAAQALIVREAHAPGRRRRLVILHASSTIAFAQGLEAGADQIHHSTLDAPLDNALIAGFAVPGTAVVCPTLTMMRVIVDQVGPPGATFAAAFETARRLHVAGVSLLVGTDGNLEPMSPAQVPFGTSLHDELENMVALVGMTPAEALRAATEVPAHAFGLRDRGVVAVGKRADIVLVDGDPTVDIRAVRNVRRVWVDGVEFGGIP